MRLGTRWLLTLTAASVGPLLVSTWVTTRDADQILMEQAGAALAVRAESLVDRLDGLHARYLGEAWDLARLPVAREVCAGVGSIGQFEDDFRAIVAADTDVAAVSLVRRDGRVIAATLPDLRGTERGHAGWWPGVLSGERAVDGVWIGPVEEGSPALVTYAAPVPEGCALALDIRAEPVWAVVRGATGFAGPGSYAVVLDERGVRIAHGLRDDVNFHPAGSIPDAADLALLSRYGSHTSQILELMTAIPAQYAAARAQDPSRVPSKYFTAANQQVSYGIGRRLRTAPWTVFAVAPESAVTGPVVTLARDQLLAAGAISAGAIVLGVVLARGLRRPLDNLTMAAQRLGEGNLEARVPVESEDEIGRLARLFNRMAAALAESQGVLEARVRARTADLDRANAELLDQREALLGQREQLEERQRELVTMNEEVRGADRMKTEFLANMSHELRTPLNAVIGFADLLIGEAGMNDTQREYLGDIRASGAHLLSLITELLDFAKIDAGKMVLDPTAVDPEIALRAAVDVLRAAALQAGVRLVVRSGATRAVWADDGKLRQILLNLASNAIKHSPRDSEVELGSADAGDRVELWVRDHGPGVPPALRPRLFQPFAQGEDPLVKRHPGTGLGLAISKRLAEAHGGEIALDDPEDGGALFRVVLPAAGPASTWGALSIPPVRGRVLVVDDHAPNRRLARAVLERAGYGVVEAADGTSALAAATASPPDLVLLDIAMPGLDGLAVIRSLRADPRTRDVPVVALTALASQEDRERIGEAGFDGFVAKPIEASALEVAVERGLRRTKNLAGSDIS